MPAPSTPAVLVDTASIVKPSGAIRRVTDVVARYSARTVDVCKAGDAVALHCSTGAGIVVLVMPLHEFAEKCRGAQDYNGRTLSPLSTTVRAPAPKPEPSEPALPRVTFGRTVSPERAALYEEILAEVARGKPTARAAAERGINYHSYVSWRHRQTDLRAREEAYRRSAPVPKPNGKLL